MILRALFIISVISSVGCGSLFSSLRSDPFAQSSPQESGGLYPEAGMLDDPLGRTPASLGRHQLRQDEWVSTEQAEAARRDEIRKGVSYSRSPNLPPSVRRRYQFKERVTREDFVDKRQDAGSLWAPGGQTNYFFTKNRIKNSGDLLSIKVQKSLVEHITREVMKTLDQKEVEVELNIAQDRIRKQALGIDMGEKSKEGEAAREVAGAAANAAANTTKKKAVDPDDIEIPEATYQDIDVRSGIQINEGDIILAEVVDRYPNGNYKVRATKRVAYRGSMRLVNLVGVAKGTDVNDMEVVESDKLYEYRLAVYR